MNRRQRLLELHQLCFGLVGWFGAALDELPQELEPLIVKAANVAQELEAQTTTYLKRLAAGEGQAEPQVIDNGADTKHCPHLTFDPHNPPLLSNPYASMLQRLGLANNTDKFGSGTATPPDSPGASAGNG